MANISGAPTVGSIDLYSSSATVPAGLQVGQLIEGQNGKAFRLVKAGASALVVGNLIQSSAVDTNWTEVAVAVAAAKGDTVVALTNGGTAVTANMFDGGSFLVGVNSASGTNLAHEYTIIGHTTDATTSGTVYFTLDKPLRVALTVSTTKVTIRRSPWSGVIQCPTTLTGTPAGVAIYAIPAAEYGWLQVRGVCAALHDNSTFAVGSALSNSAATAGAVGVVVAATARCIIGHAMQAQASGHAGAVQLNIN